MGQNLLESGSEEQEHGGPSDSTELRNSSDRLNHRASPSERPRYRFRGLESTGWSKLVDGLSREEVELLHSAWRDSTWKTYSSAWTQWTRWCKEKNIIPSKPSAQQVASYLHFLHHTKKLAFRTILVQKSVIVNFANPEEAEKLSSHPLVKSMMKAISIQEASSITPKNEVWNMEILIKWLKEHPPKEDSIYQVSRHVAMLLLLATGRRIHDLTLLSINVENCSTQNDGIIFWPKFGSKTDDSKHRQSGWKLSRSDQTEYDIVKWVKLLMELSRERRRARPNLDNLFITTRGKVKAASRAIIAGWIRTIFLELRINASPGSIRSAVSSHNYQNNVALDTVLRRGNWRGSENFFKHYCKIVEKSTEPATNPLFQLFDPV